MTHLDSSHANIYSNFTAPWADWSLIDPPPALAASVARALVEGRDMVIEPAPRATSTPPAWTRRSTATSRRRWWLHSATLRLRAWWLGRAGVGEHPVADLIAAGKWAALDELLDDLARETPPEQWEDERRHGT